MAYCDAFAVWLDNILVTILSIGPRGPPGPRGRQGQMGPPGSSGGTVYTRWGKKTCRSGTELLYQGMCIMNIN
jgi:hypothetical protein